MRTHFNSRDLNIDFFADPDYYSSTDDLFDSDGGYIEYEELESKVCTSLTKGIVETDEFELYID